MESSLSDSDEIAVAASMAAAAFGYEDKAAQKRNLNEWRPGRAGNREPGILEASKRIEKDYSWHWHDGRSLFTQSEFEHAFHMACAPYKKLRVVVLNVDSFFRQNLDAANKNGGSTDMIRFAALQMLTEGR